MLIRILLLAILGGVAYWRYGWKTAVIVVAAYIIVVALAQYLAARANQARAVQILQRPLSADEKEHYSDVGKTQIERQKLLEKRPKEGGWS
jgi:hypothetical protein